MFARSSQHLLLTGAAGATDRRDTSCLIAGCLRASQASSPSLRRSPRRPTLPPISLGAGVRTSFVHTSPDDGDDTNTFVLDSARIYVSGPVTEKIKFMFNTEYDGASNKIGVLDAVARFEMSPKFNIWMGRFLPPSDRANLYGPYYAHHWGVYTDGIQNGHPFVFQGRDNGVTYWGDFSKVKVSAGVFDGQSATGDPELLTAARVQIDFWDKENGYYLNGTYYGAKNLLGVGAAIQAQDGDTATTLDFLFEKRLGDGGGVLTIESEYANYDQLGGYDGQYGSSEGAYVLGAFLFPKAGRHGEIRGARQVRRRRPSARAARWRTTTRTRPSSTSTTSSRSSTRD